MSTILTGRNDDNGWAVSRIGAEVLEAGKKVGRIAKSWQGRDTVFKFLDAVFAYAEWLARNSTSETLKDVTAEGHKTWSFVRLIGGTLNIFAGTLPETYETAKKCYAIGVSFFNDRPIEIPEKRRSLVSDSFVVKAKYNGAEVAILREGEEVNEEEEGEEVRFITIDSDEPISVTVQLKYNEIAVTKLEKLMALGRELSRLVSNIGYIGAFGFAAPVTLLIKMHVKVSARAKEMGHTFPIFMAVFHAGGLGKWVFDLAYQQLAYYRATHEDELTDESTYKEYIECLTNDILGIFEKGPETVLAADRVLKAYKVVEKGIPPAVALPLAVFVASLGLIRIWRSTE